MWSENLENQFTAHPCVLQVKGFIVPGGRAADNLRLKLTKPGRDVGRRGRDRGTEGGMDGGVHTVAFIKGVG